MHSFITGILIVLLLIAAWQDIRSFRIPNTLIFVGTIIGVLSNSFLSQDISRIGLLVSLTGLVVGLVLLLPLYLLRAMGAGDIKLMAMVGAFVGPISMVNIALYVLLAGGVLAMIVVLLRGKLSKLTDNLKNMLFMRLAGSSTASLPTTENLHQSAGKLPYGVAIAAGTIIYLVTIH